MIIILATFVIIISFVIFFYLFANILTPLLIDIPATIKFKRKGFLENNLVLKNYIKIIAIHSVILLLISFFTCYLFIKYSFDFSVSISIGACLALFGSLWKIIWLFLNYSDNHSAWLDFYTRENIHYLSTTDRDILNKALGKK